MSASFATLEAEGWVKRETPGFNAAVGPVWVRGAGLEHTMGLLVEERHTNLHIGTLHGGALASFADIGLGSGIHAVLGEVAYRCVTAALNIQYLSVARVGEFVTVRPEVVRHSKDLIFIRGLICVGDKNIASADGIWKVMNSSK